MAMKRGFTLIELMVVVGIMTFLGVAATGGYSALQRGMSERAAVDAATSLFRAAKERALVDRTPTVVFCYNRLVNEATDAENAVVVGEAVAVRRAGRVTWASGQTIVDEFLDVVGSYDIVPSSKMSNRKGMRLWKFGDTQPSAMEYSIVADAVEPIELPLTTFEGWANGEMGSAPSEAFEPSGNMRDKESNSGELNFVVYAFRDTGRSDFPPSGGWKAGVGYGFEFARVQLPNNFIFGNAVPNRSGKVEQAGQPLYFDPDNIKDFKLEVQFCMPDGSGMPKPRYRAGVASSEEKGQVL